MGESGFFYVADAASAKRLSAEGGSDAIVLAVGESAVPAKGQLALRRRAYLFNRSLAAAKEAGKPVFVDITGHGCVNCREMESRVWSDPQVLDILRNDYIIVALYTDDKGRLKEEDWVTTEDGKVLKHIGRANSYIARTRFGVNAQPNYILLSPDGEMLAPVRGYDLSIPGFVEFLNSGLGKTAD